MLSTISTAYHSPSLSLRPGMTQQAYEKALQSNALTALPKMLEKKHAKKSTWDKLAMVGSVLTAAASSIILFSPILSKRFNANQQTILKRGFRLNSIAAFFNYIYAFQMGMNTNQPIKLYAKSLHVLCSVGDLIRPLSMPIRAFGAMGLGLWGIGLKNDVENYNHPDKRHEIRLRHWRQLLTKESLLFALRDTQEILSFKPWRKFLKVSGHKETWLRPSGDIAAISSQLQFLTGFVILSLYLPFLSQFRKTALKSIVPALGFVATILAGLPEVMRAWESKREKDGKLTLIGTPLNAIGRAFFLSLPSKQHWSGLTGIGGGVFMQLGTNMTSQKHDYLIRYMESLYAIASRSPDLKVSDVLYLIRSDPNQQKLLRHGMGQVRVDFVQKMLQEAAFREEHGERFVDIMRNILQSRQNLKYLKASRLA